MLLLSFLMLVMLKMLSVVVMDMTLMDIGCELNSHMAGEDDRPNQTAVEATVELVAVAVAEEVVLVESLGTPIIVSQSLDYLHQHHGKTSRITCVVLEMFVSLKFLKMVGVPLESWITQTMMT